MSSISSKKIIIFILITIFVSPVALSQSNLVFGSKVQFLDPDNSRSLSPFFAIPKFAFVDLNSDGTPGSDEPVYLHIDPTTSKVGANDVRLTPFGGHPSGSQVAPIDADYNMDLRIFGTLSYPRAAEMRYFDADGDRSYSLADPVYLQFKPCTIATGDVRITSYLGHEAGSRVLDSQGDCGKSTKTLPGTLSFFNSNGNINDMGEGVYDKGDAIYMDTQNPFYVVTVGDIRLSI